MFSKLNPLTNVKEFLQNTHILTNRWMTQKVLRNRTDNNSNNKIVGIFYLILILKNCTNISPTWSYLELVRLGLA